MVLPADPASRLASRVLGTSLEVTAAAPNGRPGVRIEVDLVDAVGYWQPGGRSGRTLPADWAGSTVVSLVRSAPVGALYDAAGRVLLGWAADEATAELAVSVGVSEEQKSFVVQLRPIHPLSTDLTVILDTSLGPLTDVVPRLAAWLSHRCAGDPLRPPPLLELPVWSTWYSFTQDIDHDLITAEAARAAQLGCGWVFIDDGWQRLGHNRGYQGCGDWVPDETKFPDLAATIRALHADGLGVALWIAPLLLGPDSDTFADLASFASHRVDALNCHVLDPRQPRVRTFVSDTCLRLAQNYKVDVLKVDFLDQAGVYHDDATGGDLDDVGLAMAELLAQLRRCLADAGHGDVAFEFRQPYVSPAIARYGEILRASDCPADSVLNRQSTIDARLISVGQVVHADPMMWGTAGGAEAVAQQLHAGWFAVPQISMPLGTLSPEQTAALRGLLALWREHAAITLHGDLQISGAEHSYDLISATRSDLNRTVIVRYAPLVVDLDNQPAAETTVINATPHDRVVLRTTRPITGGTVRSASATPVAPVRPARPGLIELTIPTQGSATLLSGLPWSWSGRAPSL